MSSVSPEESPFALEVGARLRAVRRQKGLSLEAVEQSSGREFRASILGAYERGQRRISVRRLHRLAHLYGVPVEQFLPRDGRFALADGAGTEPPVRKKVTFDLARLAAAACEEREILQRYTSMIQLERQDFNGRLLTVRWDDLRIIAAFFKRTPEGMYERLVEMGVLVTSPAPR
jgi:transcriptional regulator with XRE-family HTH domain